MLRIEMGKMMVNGPGILSWQRRLLAFQTEAAVTWYILDDDQIVVNTIER